MKVDEKEMFDFVIWVDENCFYINPETSLWESQLFNLKDLETDELYKTYKKEIRI